MLVPDLLYIHGCFIPIFLLTTLHPFIVQHVNLMNSLIPHSDLGGISSWFVIGPQEERVVYVSSRGEILATSHNCPFSFTAVSPQFRCFSLLWVHIPISLASLRLALTNHSKAGKVCDQHSVSQYLPLAHSWVSI